MSQKFILMFNMSIQAYVIQSIYNGYNIFSGFVGQVAYN